MPSDNGVDDYYQVYAWDVVDIFFATTVASLPALNGVVDVVIAKLKALGSTSASSLLGRVHTFGLTFQRTGEFGAQLSDKSTGKTSSHSFVAVEGDKNSRNAPDQFDEPILSQAADFELQRPGEHFRH